MNKFATMAVGLCFVLGGATTATAAPKAENPSMPPTDRHTVCLWTYQIDHTHFVSPKTLLFYMRGGKIWKNTLVTDCRGLNFNGFAYVTRDGQICSNMQSIKVLRTHEVCLLGEFTPYAPEPPEAAH